MNDGGANDASNDSTNDAADDTGDAGDDAAADGGDAGPVACGSGDDIRTGAACGESIGGVFAIKTVLDVWWQDDIDPPLIDPGRGYITVFQKVTIADVCDDGTIGRVELQSCGLTLPTHTTFVACRAYQMAVPDSVWDAPTMPTWLITGSVSSFDLDGVMMLGGVNAMIGLDLNDGGAEWPTHRGEVTCGTGMGQLEMCFPDHDGDGTPGILFLLANIGTNYRSTGCGLEGDQPVRYAAIHTDLSTAFCEPDCRRAVEFQGGFRTQLAARAALRSCMGGAAQLDGDSSTTAVGVRAVDCKLSDGEPCMEFDGEVVDSTLQNYNILAADEAPPTDVQASPCDCSGGCMGESCQVDQTPSVGPRTAMVRLGDTSSSFDCEDVRSAADAAFPGFDF